MIGSITQVAGNDVKSLLDLVRNADKYEAAIDEITKLAEDARSRMRAAEDKARDLASIAKGLDDRQALYAERMQLLESGQEDLAQAVLAVEAAAAQNKAEADALVELRRSDAAAVANDQARIAAELESIKTTKAKLADLEALAKAELDAANADRAEAAKLMAEAASKLAAIKAAAAALAG